ncbi:endonuclease III [Halobacteriovorax sp. GB3]|uniref:endonuclease III n=1 Tax=Halobacteriovorax sp. GB3 TaxID=2719615 RepID=UPI00235FE42A|nr:endonuclease III [Halobacteriovorax sp. GB3]MDD0853772.1 endonuclease III [Halobacteriovorax sp. GB3]
MKKLERVAYIHERLDDLFPETPVPLDHTNAFTLLIAVLLSAQCTDERVNKVTPNLFKHADNPFDMVKLSIEEIEAIVKPCGLAPRKAKAIWNLSQILIDKHNGEVPASFEHLEELPGVGHKTAGVVMAQAFDVPAFPVDTHIHRLAQQWQLTSGKNVEQTEKDLKRLFPKEAWNRLHLQIIFFGRKFCSARQCDGLQCELCQTCFPDRKRPRKYKKA